jgi:hypothetical protein
MPNLCWLRPVEMWVMAASIRIYPMENLAHASRAAKASISASSASNSQLKL